MSTQPITSYVDGEFVPAASGAVRTLVDVNRRPVLEVAEATPWTLEAALETASRTTSSLAQISDDTIIRMICSLAEAMRADLSSLEVLARLSGRSIKHLRQAADLFTSWAANIERHRETMFGPDGGSAEKVPIATAPVVVVLPSTAFEEILYVLPQALMARCPVILRPPSKGVGPWPVHQIADAFQQALARFDDEDAECIRGALQYLITPAGSDYLPQLAVDGWNYVCFGDSSTLTRLEQQLREVAAPRKFVGYGTGLSSTIALDDADIDQLLPDLAESIAFNAGNDCTSTKVIYAERRMASRLETALPDAMRDLRCGDPLDEQTVGTAPPDNVAFILEEFGTRRGRLADLRLDNADGTALLHPSLVSVSPFEGVAEFPGPIACLRRFDTLDELHELVAADLRGNGLDRSLVTSVYSCSPDRVRELLPSLRSWTVRANAPTHAFSFHAPHQGIYLGRELVDVAHLEAPGAA